jgi:YD repeat-containing protein
MQLFDAPMLYLLKIVLPQKMMCLVGRRTSFLRLGASHVDRSKRPWVRSSWAFDANGVRTAMAYDGLNRLSSVSYTGESGYQTPAVNYTYDQQRSGFHNLGALTKVTTAAVSGTQATPATETLYDFDPMGRLVKHVQTIGDQSYQIEYAYNLAGQLTGEKYPSGRIVATGYDSKGRLSTVADAQRTFLASVGFGANSLPSQLAYGNGTVQNFGYNTRLQMTS